MRAPVRLTFSSFKKHKMDKKLLFLSRAQCNGSGCLPRHIVQYIVFWRTLVPCAKTEFVRQTLKAKQAFESMFSFINASKAFWKTFPPEAWLSARTRVGWGRNNNASMAIIFFGPTFVTSDTSLPRSTWQQSWDATHPSPSPSPPAHTHQCMVLWTAGGRAYTNTPRWRGVIVHYGVHCAEEFPVNHVLVVMMMTMIM